MEKEKIEDQMIEITFETRYRIVNLFLKQTHAFCKERGLFPDLMERKDSKFTIHELNEITKAVLLSGTYEETELVLKCIRRDVKSTIVD